MFNAESPIVKSYVLLIKSGTRTIEQVPDYANLKEVVLSVLSSSN